MARLPSKPCAICGRLISWRKKWERDWDAVRYCSDACRRSKLDATDSALEQSILRLLHARGAGKTICPSDAARKVADSDDEALWRPLMERARQAARRLVARGDIVITQVGHVVDPSTARGPIRLKLTSPSS
ncbi:MAG: hypothetical protein NVS9B15_23070 [Acidobacteriaceae bacterium]